ncbi:MAG: cold shock domain-containing protein [Nitrospirota bacterium]|nr:cold shock domain-containing protein [Nitrospirota bacterium]
MAQIYRGTVERLGKDSGQGTIVREDGQKVRLHFVHMVGATFKTLKAGDTVEFECEEGRRGPEARNVVKVES